MRKKLATGLLVLSLTAAAANAQSTMVPGHHLTGGPQTSWVQQVRVMFDHLFNWL